jgi:hypothetical protein
MLQQKLVFLSDGRDRWRSQQIGVCYLIVEVQGQVPAIFSATASIAEEGHPQSMQPHLLGETGRFLTLKAAKDACQRDFSERASRT